MADAAGLASQGLIGAAVHYRKVGRAVHKARITARATPAVTVIRRGSYRITTPR